MNPHLLSRLAAALFLAGAAGLASGCSGTALSDADSGSGADASTSDSGTIAPDDAGAADTGTPDAGPNCSATGCTGFTYCDTATQECLAGCDTSTQCGANQGCDLVAHACVCDTGFHNCQGTCVSKTSTSTCGLSCVACDVPTNGRATCDGANCGFQCLTGFHLCGSACVPDSSVSACGPGCATCNQAPPNGHDVCAANKCDFQCDSGFHACQGACLADSSLNSCGSSCSPCPAPPPGAVATCLSGQCGWECGPGYLKCGSGCCSVRAVASGDQHTCAITTTGAVKCWGKNNQGQVGNGTTGAPQLTPADVALPTANYTLLASGTAHTCASPGSGSISCWGSGIYGQLGDGLISSSATPVAVSNVGNLDQVQALAAGGRHSCAVSGTLDGGIGTRCWGDNSKGQLGNGTTSSSSVPAAAALPSVPKALAAGDFHTCALMIDGTVMCWGDNTYGQVGNGGTVEQHSPVAVSGLTGVTRLAAGQNHTCATAPAPDAGLVTMCWGKGAGGQLGRPGNFADAVAPVPAMGAPAGTAVLTGGGEHTCSAAAGGWLACWGLNSSGQLGNNSTVASSLAVQAQGVGAATIASAGGAHTCAVLPPPIDGGVASQGMRCWGSNLNGQLGTGNTTDSPIPLPISGR